MLKGRDETLFYAIIALVLFSIVLLVMDYRNRYCWLFTMMVTGMVIAFFSTMIYLTKFGNYYYIFNKLFILDYSIFSYVGRTIKLPLSTTGRIMNLGIALYMLAVPLFVYEFAKNRVHNKILKKNNITKFIVMFSLLYTIYVFMTPRTRIVSTSNTTCNPNRRFMLILSMSCTISTKSGSLLTCFILFIYCTSI